MPKPFYDRLVNYFSDVGKVLRGEASVASIFPNSTDIGSSREKIYAKVLKLHLPSSTNVLFGGFLFDLEGKESKQIDLIVTNDNSLQFNFNNQTGDGKSFACIDGCLAVASLKSELTSSELVNALENIASLPDKMPLDGRLHPIVSFDGYEEWPFKIIYAIDGIGMDTCTKVLLDFYQKNPEIPLHKRPNIIHVSGKYWIFRNVYENVTRDGRKIMVGDYSGDAVDPDINAFLVTIIHIQLIAQNSKYVVYVYNEIFDSIQRTLRLRPSQK